MTRVRPTFALLSLPLLTVLSGSALAQVTRLDPFVGERFEGFETQHTQVGGGHPPSPQPCLIDGLFQGHGALCSIANVPLVMLTSSSSTANCGSVHRTGSFYAAGLFGPLVIDFAAPQAAFGGHFLTDSGNPMNPASLQWEARFLDALGAPLGTDPMQLPACGEFAWAGWSLPPGTVRIEFHPSSSGGTLWMDDLMVSAAAPIGTTYCVPNETSVEARAQCAAIGSAVAADRDLTLVASQLPSSVFGFFLTSRDAGFVANPGGSAGNLCLQGSIGRFVGPGQIMGSGPAGTFSLALDLDQLPQGAVTVAASAGETWRFQAWFRDVTGGPAPMPTSNFTSGLEVTFE